VTPDAIYLPDYRTLLLWIIWLYDRGATGLRDRGGMSGSSCVLEGANYLYHLITKI
jgi:hypothetical protein